MELPDITKLDAIALDALKDAIDKRLVEMREAEAPALLERFEAEARKLGLDMKQLVLRRGTKRGRGRPRNASNGTHAH